MSHKNTVVCTQAFPAPENSPYSGRIWAEIDIDHSERRMGPLGYFREGGFEQGSIVLTSEVLDTIWGDSGMISLVTKNSIYIVDSRSYHANQLRAKECGFPTDRCW